MYTIEIRHNFETAHRLSSPNSPRKCRSIHGHSWWARIELSGAALDAEGILVEFGAFKKAWRAFLDAELDHHLVLHRDDPMAAAVRGVDPEARLLLLDENPTTEVLARWLGERSVAILHAVDPEGRARVSAIHLQETSVNAVRYVPVGGSR